MNPMGAPRSDSRRPLWVRLFSLWLLALAVANLWRGLTLWRTRTLLAELRSKLSPVTLTLYVALVALCGAGLVVSGIGLWLRREWGRRAARPLIVIYFAINQAYVWLYVQSGLLWERRWINLALALVVAGLCFGVLTWHRSRQWLGLQ